MGSKKAVKVGYRYLFGIHQGFGRGPMDEMVEIKVGGKVAWTGSVTENQTITIDKPELFGGDDGEGGIKGTMDVMMGGPDQPRNERLAAMLGGIVPAFRGVCTAFYDGLVTSLNPYPKAWEFRWRRALAGWDGEPWYPEKAVIWLAGGTIRAMNPAHILYEAETNRDWGRKKDRTRLDDAAWRAAADQLYAEGFGLCLRWVRQDSVNAFMGHVLDHIAGNLYPSRTTGLMKLTLVRDDYDPELLPLFTPDTGLLGVDEDDNAADAGSINEIVVKWRSPIDDQVRQVRERNLAAVRSAGGDIISQTVEYLGLPIHELAGRVAVRDLRAKIGAKRWKLRLDRRAYQIEPGSVFRFSDPKRGLENIVVRAGRIEDGTHTSGAITITALLDVFGLPATSFTTPPPSNWVPPNTTPAAATIRRVAETTWRDLAQTIDAANLALVDPTACFIGAMAVRPTGLSLGYEIQTRVGSAAYETRAQGDFCPSGLLLADIPAELGPTIIQLIGTEGLDQVTLGSAALLDDEIVRIDAFDLGTNTLTIGRGCIDSVPAAHAAGARLWCFEDFAGADPTEYSPSVTVQTRLLPNTSSGPLDPVLAPTDSLAMAQRQARPYPPGQFKIGGLSYPVSIEGDVVLTWAHRDRLLQADQLIDTTMGNIGPEAGTTYSCRLLRADTSAVLDSETDISATTATLETTYEGQVIAELWAMRDGLESWQRSSHQFERIASAELWTPLNMATVPQIYLDAQESVITNVSGFASSISNLGAMGINGNFSQSTAGSRPAILEEELNGKRVLRFENDYLLGATAQQLALFRNVPAAWVFAVYKKRTEDGTAASRYLFFSTPNNSDFSRFSAMVSVSSGAVNTPHMFARRLDAEAQAGLAGASVVQGNYAMTLHLVDFSTRAGSITINGVIDASNATMMPTAGSTSDTLASRALSIGATSLNAFHADMDLAAMVISNTQPSAADIDRLFGWAAHDRGLTANLPTDHPYKTTPPYA